MSDEYDGWHFAGDTLRDGRPLPGAGETLTLPADEKPVLCEQGYHASSRIIDALQYAPGGRVAMVFLHGDLVVDEDKAVGRCRTMLTDYIDVSRVLHEFACQCAEAALSRVKTPDPRSIAAIKAKRDWLEGKISDQELHAAWAAARDALGTAARAAALADSRDAARAAALADLGTAARAAAWTISWTASCAAARAAAEAASWDASWDAARAAQNEQLEAMVCKGTFK